MAKKQTHRNQNNPSKDIASSKGRELEGKRIVLCISSSVGCIRCPELARELIRHGADVHAVMTLSATKLLTPTIMEWATGNPVVTELTGKLEHIALAEKGSSDLILVYPATANTIGKMASGIDDTAVTSVLSVALGSGVPIFVAPAMHLSMFNHPILKENIERLKRLGVRFLEPIIEEGKAKVPEVSEVIKEVVRALAPQEFAGLRFLVTAGATVEYIDPVRIITNKGSGRMGIALAEEAKARGAEVTIVYGRGTVLPPSGMKVIRVETTEEMRDAVVSTLEAEEFHVVIASAAPADYTPAKRQSSKLRTEEVSSLRLELKATPKIIDEAKQVSPKSFLVAFKAEHGLKKEEIVEKAYRRLLSSGSDLIVANDVVGQGRGFESETNEVWVVDRSRNILHIPLTSKKEVARKIMEIVCEKLGRRI